MLNPVNQAKNLTINVIFIEDREDDYELIKRKIQGEGYTLNAARVDTANEYETLLNNGVWDIVISDNAMPVFSAAAALEITRSKFPFLPFIIVSGTIGEEAAVAAMRSGANDYILKDDLARLVPAIERELRDHEIIRAKHAADKALKASEEKYRLLAENIQDLVCLHSPDSTYLWLSPSAEKILGYKPEELMGTKGMDLVHPEDQKGDPLDFFKDLPLGSFLRICIRTRRKDGVYIHVEAMVQPIYESGKIVRIVSTARDITEKQRAFDLLAANEAKYQGVIESMAEALIIYDNQGKVTTFNKSAARILGVNASDTPRQFEEKFKEKNHFFNAAGQEILHSELPSQFTLKTREAYLQVTIGVRQNGKDLSWLSVNSDPFLQPDGKYGVVVSLSDITRQKLYEERVSTVAKELTTLIDTANAPIFGIDRDGKINEWNLVAAKVTGYSKAEVVGKKLIDEFILDDYKIMVCDLLKNVLRGKDVTSYELPIYTRTGKVVTILFNATARRNDRSAIIGVISVGQNITELIEYREQLETKVAERTRELHNALQKEKDLVSLKSKFVSMASHEFKTPLSTINFAADFVKRYHTKLKAKELNRKLDKIQEQVGHMTYLLDDVLLIGKSESGKIRLHPVMTNLMGFCKKIIEEVIYSTKNTHEISLSVVSEKKQIYIDEKLLRNILINLLSNAIKFSPGKDKVLLEVICTRDGLSFRVKDWGMGIEKEDLNKIFEPFHRNGNVGSIQGTGLGLSIVKKAVELQQGKIAVESIVEEGTTFKIEIPLVQYTSEQLSKKDGHQ